MIIIIIIIIFINRTVTYKDAATSEKAIELLNSKVLQGRNIYLKLDRKYEKKLLKNLHKVYVINIPWEMKGNNLKDHFQELNPVMAFINCSLSGRSLGSGILGFNNIEEAIEAKKRFHTTLIGGREIRVSFIILLLLITLLITIIYIGKS